MVKTLIWLLFLLVTVYGVIPGFIVRLFGFRAFQRGLSSNHVALTFDDGPHELYTSRLLDLLQSYGIKATFFIVGKYAEQHPEIIARMHREGHLIGIHNYVHKTNWLMTPMEVKRQIEKSADIIEGITGERPIYYRPPWGIVNLFDIFTLGSFRLVLWSIIVGDWRRRSKRHGIKTKLLRRLNSGDIILLHDNGETFGAYPQAPEEMLGALEEFIHEVIPKGYQFVRVDEMISDTERMKQIKSVQRMKWLPAIWLKWESLFSLVYRVERKTDMRIFHIKARTYSGRPIELDDGARIENGDQIVELHFDNQMLYDIGHRSKSPVQLAIRLVRLVEKDLPHLAEHIAGDPKYRNVKGLYGVTLINRGPEKIGFTILDLPKSIFSRLTWWYLRQLLRAIHPNGGERLEDHADLLVPKIVAMSKKELMGRYGSRDGGELPTSKDEIAAGKADAQVLMGK